MSSPSKLFLIVYTVNERLGFGEGSLGHKAIWLQAGAFKTMESALRYIEQTDKPYGIEYPKVMEIEIKE